MRTRGGEEVAGEGTNDQSKFLEMVLAMPSSEPMKKLIRSSMAVDGSRSRWVGDN